MEPKEDAFTTVEPQAGEREVARNLLEAEPLVKTDRDVVSCVGEEPSLGRPLTDPVETHPGQNLGDPVAPLLRLDEDAGQVVASRRCIGRGIWRGLEEPGAAVAHDRATDVCDDEITLRIGDVGQERVAQLCCVTLGRSDPCQGNARFEVRPRAFPDM